MHVVAAWSLNYNPSERKTLIETKNHTLKFLKRHYSTVRSMRNVAVLTEDGAFALLFRSRPGGFDSSRFPTPGQLPSKAKRMLMPVGQPGGGGRGGLVAAGIDWYISHSFFRTAILRKFFGIRFSYKHCNFSHVCLLVKMASKTVTRSITVGLPWKFLNFDGVLQRLHSITQANS